MLNTSLWFHRGDRVGFVSNTSLSFRKALTYGLLGASNVCEDVHARSLRADTMEISSFAQGPSVSTARSGYRRQRHLCS